ncbi:adenosine deaminase-like protein [Plakobranchus ocellatus]|uniref:Adenosine deaminase-like protein n=1 Tax=Plakobranchus ocellatus TaxID=259542 RepID=A0AAV4D1A7_9GAST|nr:adenosine deaminase-like protein [Plakobranchus ocellatus]
MADGSINIDDFCHRLPKVELHAHLNTSYSMKFLRELARHNGIAEEDFVQDLCLKEAKPLDEGFALFVRLHQIFKTEEAIYRLTCSVIKEFAEDNVKYLELRSTPKMIPETGMTRDLYMQTMVRAVKDCEKEGLDITVRLLVSIDRRHGVEVARIAVDLADKLMQSTQGLVLGVDFSGDPKVGDATDFIPVFLDAAKRGLKLSLHLAEIPLYEETKNVLQACCRSCTMRIGHGTFLHRYDLGKGHEEMEDIVLQWKIPIEACVTSNILSKTVDCPGTHHFHYWHSKQHPVILCTDGKGAFGCSLTDEYSKVAKEFGFGKRDLLAYALSTVDSIFEGDQVKQRLRETMRVFGQKESINGL